MYNCFCGKVFVSSQSYNGHKRHCKVGRTEEEILKIKHADSLLREHSQITWREKAKHIQQIKDYEWLASNPVCEFCGKQGFSKYSAGKYASGRFCSNTCARKYTSLLAKKNPDSLKAYTYGKISVSPYEQQIYDMLKSKGVYFIWNATSTQYHIKGCRYVLDFYFPEYNLDLEYDGRFHRDNVDHDNTRDAFLASFGIFVYRIKDYNSDNLRALFEEFWDWFDKTYIGDSYKSSTRVFDACSEGAVPSSPATVL